MTNDIGMVKEGLGQAERTNPSAKVEKTELAQQAEANTPQAKDPLDPNSTKVFAEQVATGLNELVQELHRELQFTVDDVSGQTVIKVIDKERDQVVRQIPSEEVLRLRKRLQEAAGMIFQDSA